ncbi:MAG: UDP-N-acetylmuramate dehydrogenase [Planctomycetes bacterium]|nr:UDP-N-acetylmuramate dehydrogenase [Planctomycetota bacterium]
MEKYLQTHGVSTLRDEPLRRHCTWRIGGPADVMVFPATLDQLRDMMTLARDLEMPWIVIGKGSNLLFSDAGFRGLVIKLDRAFSKVTIEGGQVTAQSGVSMPRLACMTARAGLTGLEHTIGIPGSLGGLVAINGGSLRQSIGDVVTTVTVVTPEGDIQAIPKEECAFSYRHSNLLHSGNVIAEVTLELQKGHAQMILKHMLGVLRERQAKFPLTLPNCGSVFTSRPELYHTLGPPGKLIEDLGLKGLTCGGVSVSHRHANFFVNTGCATAAHVLGLVAQVRGAIHDRYGVLINTEVMYVHSDGGIEPVSAVSPDVQTQK